MEPTVEFMNQLIAALRLMSEKSQEKSQEEDYYSKTTYTIDSLLHYAEIVHDHLEEDREPEDLSIKLHKAVNTSVSKPSNPGNTWYYKAWVETNNDLSKLQADYDELEKEKDDLQRNYQKVLSQLNSVRSLIDSVDFRLLAKIAENER